MFCEEIPGMSGVTDTVENAHASADRKTGLAQTLRQRILSMELAPGATLDELALSTEFGLSRPPVREVLRQMAGEGYITLEHNRAARVTSMTFDTLRNFFLAAPMIYIATTRLAAASATPADLKRLQTIQRAFRKAIKEDDVRGRVFANDEFHLAIGEIARNEYLLPSLRRLLIDHSRIGHVFYVGSSAAADPRDNLKVAADQHDEIIDAIRQRDPDRAAVIVREHFELSRRNMASYAIPEGVEVPLVA
jgi:DNA-binding GntR family transcriptional regulator